MSATPGRLVRSAQCLATSVIVASCADSGVVNSPQLLEPSRPEQAVLSAVCTVEWKDPVNGLWTDGTKWSSGAVPGAADDVCVVADGTYTVNVRGLQSANTVTIGRPGNVGVQTLAIQGVGTGSRLTAASGMTNDGQVWLQWASGNNGTFAAVAVTDGALLNRGTLRVLSDGLGAPRFITADLVNTGTVLVEHSVSFNKPGGVYDNQGTVTINLGRTVTVAGNLGQTFRQSAGTLTATGALNIAQEALEFNGGTIVGRPTITNGALRIGAGNTGAGDFSIRGASTLTGDVAPAQTIRIHGTGPGSVLTSAVAFTNAGTIELQWLGGTNATNAGLVVTAGKLTNTGTLRTLTDPIGAPRTITADLLNAGTVSIGHTTTFNKPDGRYENAGTFIIQPARTLLIRTGAGQIFQQTAGTLTVNGTMRLDGQTFEASGGPIDGQAVIINGGTLRFPPASTGSGVFSMRDLSALAGDIPSGYTVRVNTNGAVSSTLTAATGFTNAGVLQLQPTSGNNGTSANLSVTSGMLINSGSIVTLNDVFGGTGRKISADLVNSGTIDLRTRTTFSKQNGVYTNNNVIALGNTTLTISGLDQTFVTTGQITGAGTLAFSNITMYASGEVRPAINLTNVNAHVGMGGLGVLNVFNNYRMLSGGSLNIELSDPLATPATDLINITGVAALSGTLNVSVVAGACPEGNYEFMTYGSRSGDFATRNGLDLGGGRQLQPQPGPTSYRLSSSGPPCVAPDDTPPLIAAVISGPLGNNEWYVGNVSVEWNVTDAESDVTSTTGCDETQVLDDTDGRTITCTATSAGGTTIQTVTIKRDATAPAVQVFRSPEPNESGWNNTDVRVTFVASDALSGIEGPESVVQLFTAEGENQSGSHTFTDRAGNTATGLISGINIDKSAPIAACTASPDELWTPNGKLVAISISVSSNEPGSFVLRSAVSDESNSGRDADIQNFDIGEADTDGLVRAARSGTGDGRTYTFVYDVFDSSGNRTECVATVRVPHDQGRRAR